MPTQSRQRGGLLTRLIEAEIQRLQQLAELVAQNRRRDLLIRLIEAKIQRLQQVAELVLLRFQVPQRVLRGGNLDGNAFHDAKTIAFEGDELPWIIGQ